jgi:NAD/NADP transhydrogenase alpha subunit
LVTSGSSTNRPPRLSTCWRTAGRTSYARTVAPSRRAVAPLAKQGLAVLVEQGAGVEAGFPDAAYLDKGAQITADRDELFRRADVVVQVRALGANPDAGRADLARLRPEQALVASCDPLSEPQASAEAAPRGAAIFALELVPRITRAQSMDVLSSMATSQGSRRSRPPGGSAQPCGHTTCVRPSASRSRASAAGSSSCRW